MLALALVAYLVALIEAQVEALALALFIGVLALAAGVNALGWLRLAGVAGVCRALVALYGWPVVLGRAALAA